MSDEPNRLETLADRLLAADDVAPRHDDLVRTLVDREEAADRRVRRVAFGAWQGVAALVPLVAITAFLVRVVDDGLARDAVRIAAITLGGFGLLGLFLAALTTVAWLFRSRSISLAVIERRLAALEERMLRGR